MIKTAIMQRIPEPDLMNDEAQVRAYAEADFEAPHEQLLQLFGDYYPEPGRPGPVLDLGCGAADISIRFAKKYRHAQIDAIDGAEMMLKYADQSITTQKLNDRIQLIHDYLPSQALKAKHYDTIICNSLLHHLEDPMVLWHCIDHCAHDNAAVFIMDLMRPDTEAQARELVDTYVGNEPAILQHDFYHSLLAAYRIEEVEAQLQKSPLKGYQVNQVSDRHFIVSAHPKASL